MTTIQWRTLYARPLFNFMFGSILGVALGAGVTARLFSPVISRAQEMAQSQAETIKERNDTIETLQGISDLKDTVIATWMHRAQALEGNPAVQLLAQSGHVMNEEQCRAWMGIMAVPQMPAVTTGVTTVLYESGGAALNVSLFPLPGAPRVAIGPRSEMGPRWIIPGRIQPQMVGETRKAIYYYFDSQSSQWQGPFAPERIAPERVAQ